VYKTIKKAQINEGLEAKFHNSYHLGSGGITIITKRLEKNKKTKPTELTIENHGNLNGIVNGGHQYISAMENKKKILKMIQEDEPIQQYMPFHAIVGIKASRINYIAKALNTNVQVTDSALLYNMGVFESIENVLTNAGIVEHFGKRGNEKTVKRLAYEISDNVVLMEAFNKHQYPDGTRHGTNCVSSRNKVISNYGRQEVRKEFEGMLHLLQDFWTLYETVSCTGWSKAGITDPPDLVTWVHGPNLYAGKVLRPKARGKLYQYPIIKKSSPTKMAKAATLCIMAAFRQFLHVSVQTKKYMWARPFEQVLSVWDEAGGELITLLDNKTRKMDRDVVGVLKTDTAGVWTDMYRALSKY